MLTKLDVLNRILNEKVVAIIRLDNADQVMPVIDAVHQGGISAIEVTMGTPQALSYIAQYAAHPSILIGAGSVIDAETARAAIQAGAKFLVTPVSKRSVIQTALRFQVPIFSGAYTPAEILQAHEWGADVVKVFPANALGMDYFKAVKAPMPQLQLMPTGGVTLDNAVQWIQAGACAVGIGSALTDKQAIADGDYQRITENAQRLVQSLRAVQPW